MNKTRFWLLSLAAGAMFLACTPGAASAQEGGIETFAAETLYLDGWRISQTHIYRVKDHLYAGKHKLGDALDRTFEEHRFVTGIDYGLLPDLMVSALIPYVDKQLVTRSGPGKVRFDSSGIGDIALLVKYRFYKRDWKRSAVHYGIMLGTELPTGDRGATENGVRLAPSLQPGSGSVDPFIALLAQGSMDRWRWDAAAFYKHNTEGTQEFKDGDTFSLSFIGKYRYWHAQYPGPSGNVSVGLRYKYQSRAKSDGRTVRNSGSDEVFMKFGIGFHPIPRMDLSMSCEVPLYQDYGGTQLGTDLRTVFAFGIRF